MWPRNGVGSLSIEYEFSHFDIPDTDFACVQVFLCPGYGKKIVIVEL